MQDSKHTLEVYKSILRGESKRFPKNFWVDGGKEKFVLIVRYLIEEVMGLTEKEALETVRGETMIRYKLGTPYNLFYHRGIRRILEDVYQKKLEGERLPHTEATKAKLSERQKNLTPEKRENKRRGMRENRYCEEYAEKLSVTKEGEKNPQHKLKKEQVQEIKALWGKGNYTTTTLGLKYGVGRQTIADIVYGRTWKHLK